MRFTILLTTLCLVVLQSTTNAQPNLQWARTYGGEQRDQLKDIIQTVNNDYAVVGLTESFGEGDRNSYLILVDGNGDEIWDQTYGDEEYNYSNSILEIDNGFALGGLTGTFRNGFWDAWLLKTGEDGEVQWSQTYGEDERDLGSGLALVRTPNDGFAFAGFYLNDERNYQGWLILTDEDGDELWDGAFGGQGYNYFSSIVPTAEGGYAMCGGSNSFNNDGFNYKCYLVVTNENGEELWSEVYGGAQTDQSYSLIQLEDEGFALGGATESFGAGGRDMYLVRTDEDGEMLWSQTYGGEEDDRCNKIIGTEDGGFLLLGYTESFVQAEDDRDVWLVRTDENGEMLWSQTYGGDTKDRGHDIIPTDDGGWILGGNVRSVGNGDMDYWLIKLSEDEDPNLVLNPQILMFDRVPIEFEGELVLNIHNNSNGDITIEDFNADDDAFGIEWDEEIVLEPDEDLDVTVIFGPEEVNSYENSLTITANNQGERFEASVALFGYGFDPPIIRVEPEVVDFGGIFVGEDAVRTVEMHNEGEDVLTIENIVLEDEDEIFTLNFDNLHFAFEWEFIETDENTSIIVREATIDDEPLEAGDRIGVFTPDEICAGFTVVEGDGAQGFAAWGDDPEREEVQGFVADEVMFFRLYDTDASDEYTANANFDFGDGQYHVDGLSVVRLQAAERVRNGFGRVMIAGDSQAEFDVSFSPDENQRYTNAITIITDDPDEGEIVIDLLGSGGRELTMPLDQGWNMVSLNITLHQEMYREDEDRGPDVELLLEQLRIDDENHHVLLLKDALGQFYAPEFNFNSIPFWEYTQGYELKVDEEIETTWLGLPVSADKDIPIRFGWNIIAYFPTYRLDAGAPDFEVLSPIIDNVILAKDVRGDFMVPNLNFSNMDPWREAQGYQIKVDEDVMLNYPQERENVAVVSLEKPTKPGYWTVPVSTGSNMSVLLTMTGKIGEGSEIAAFGQTGRLAGVGTVNSNGRCGIAVWGDDLSTDEVDGLEEGEAFSLKAWHVDSNLESKLSVQEIVQGLALTYNTDKFLVLKVKSEIVIPTEYYLSEAYPNPFNSATRISFGLPFASQVSVELFDISGRKIRTLIEEYKSAGNYTTTLFAADLSSGLYFVRLKASDQLFSNKIMLIK